uniref:Uncharacterized protein n=1 Tax=Cacopsylla melanoneura TaxID=428564 RepID=A0A8D9A6D9_9HEMI
MFCKTFTPLDTNIIDINALVSIRLGIAQIRMGPELKTVSKSDENFRRKVWYIQEIADRLIQNQVYSRKSKTRFAIYNKKNRRIKKYSSRKLLQCFITLPTFLLGFKTGLRSRGL